MFDGQKNGLSWRCFAEAVIPPVVRSSGHPAMSTIQCILIDAHLLAPRPYIMIMIMIMII